MREAVAPPAARVRRPGHGEGEGAGCVEGFVARRWQRAHAHEFHGWERSSGRLQGGLEAMCSAVTEIGEQLVPDQPTADAVARELPGCLSRCKELEFHQFEQTMAYGMLHLADRYGRVQQVLTELLSIGALPLRRESCGVAVLEVGAGPAPALFAAIDFYRALADWADTVAKCDIQVDTIGGPISLGTVANPVALERGPRWSQYLHALSETLLAQTSTAEPARLVYRVDYDDLAGFDQGRIHRERLEAAARGIRAEFDGDDESVSRGAARQMAQDEHLGGVSAYDLIVLSNMLTTSDMVETLSSDIQQLGRALTPGGVLVIIGSAGVQYSQIWERIAELIGRASVTGLELSTEPRDSHLDPRRAAAIEAHIRGEAARLRERCSPAVWAEIEPQLHRELRDSTRVFTFGRFRLMAWRRQH